MYVKVTELEQTKTILYIISIQNSSNRVLCKFAFILLLCHASMYPCNSNSSRNVHVQREYIYFSVTFGKPVISESIFCTCQQICRQRLMFSREKVGLQWHFLYTAMLMDGNGSHLLPPGQIRDKHSGGHTHDKHTVSVQDELKKKKKSIRYII